MKCKGPCGGDYPKEDISHDGVTCWRCYDAAHPTEWQLRESAPEPKAKAGEGGSGRLRAHWRDVYHPQHLRAKYRGGKAPRRP